MFTTSIGHYGYFCTVPVTVMSQKEVDVLFRRLPFVALRLLTLALVSLTATCGPAPMPPLEHECGPLHGPTQYYFEQVLHWTPDGSHLLFDYDGTIQVVDAQGTRMHEVVDMDPRHSRSSDIAPSQSSLSYGLYFDVSPQGTRVVYTSCEFREVNSVKTPERLAYNYEIAVVNLDGTERKRLTMDDLLDHYPVWSPDGSTIAFLSRSRARDWEIFTMAADGSDRQVMVSDATLRKTVRGESENDSSDSEDAPWLVGVDMSPPQWSPDGERLAFRVGEFKSDRGMTYLYTVHGDGTGLTRVAATVRRARHATIPGDWAPVLPAWSPDGDYLAFVMADDKGDPGGVYTARPDGTELRQVLAPQTPTWSVANVAWSSDGSEILIFSRDKGIFIVQVEGNGLHQHIELSPPPIAAGGVAWSPDGNHIALYVRADPYREVLPQLYIISRDGNDRRDLIRVDDEGNLAPANPPQDGS